MNSKLLQESVLVARLQPLVLTRVIFLRCWSGIIIYLLLDTTPTLLPHKRRILLLQGNVTDTIFLACTYLLVALLQCHLAFAIAMLAPHHYASSSSITSMSSSMSTGSYYGRIDCFGNGAGGPQIADCQVAINLFPPGSSRSEPAIAIKTKR